jgi:hypothetical protein
VDSRSWYKLFDGVEDDLGWEHYSKSTDKFVEMDLTKIKPTFSQISICGWHIDSMQVTVRNGESWTPLEVQEEITSEFKRVFNLKTPICPDGMRLDFPNEEIVELFEIDVFA